MRTLRFAPRRSGGGSTDKRRACEPVIPTSATEYRINRLHGRFFHDWKKHGKGEVDENPPVRTEALVLLSPLWSRVINYMNSDTQGTRRLKVSKRSRRYEPQHRGKAFTEIGMAMGFIAGEG